MQRIDTQQECLTSHTLKIWFSTRVNHYFNTRLSSGFANLKELGNEYIATETDALKEESVASVAEFISTSMCWNMALLQQGGTYNLEEMIKSLKMWKHSLHQLRFHEWSKFLLALIFPRFPRKYYLLITRLLEPIHVCSAESWAHQCLWVMVFVHIDHTIVPEF